ncbi:FAD/NAD(P)-binding domain-containing protein [Acaromyces ingoldii]|uniref:FAD/NAD(P)-binding domain-containing protein n=1 Tax=Acaromyces ingoldii TaxID=215250 RepID=A0A316YT39_9BASI|nr:FAD/NAD(P)-binding domain-containing protein [Acaromyces ingoldii]PWN92577.1 FAD/NAD(P)-binding domain-containing protein [Acaromyces ingoldii]
MVEQVRSVGNPVEIGYADAKTLPWKSVDAAMDRPRPFKVICIGAGVSGIYAGIRITKTMANVDLKIFDKNPDFGGTWFENRYLGCACDIPAHCYQLSFEPNPNWSSFYAPAREIGAYWKGVALKYGLDGHTQFNKMVSHSKWDENAGEWIVEVTDVETKEVEVHRANVVIQGVGGLNNWKWPDVEGITSFKGHLVHSAAWDQKYDFKDKRVALIGSGSTAIQILPQLAGHAKHVDQYVRSATWIGFPFAGEETKAGLPGADKERYSDEEQQRFQSDPKALAEYRHRLMTNLNSIHSVTMQESELQKGAQATFWNNMQAKLEAKPHIAKFLKPNFPVGCRRLTPGPGYLESLNGDDVGFVTDEIARIDESGIVDKKGAHREYDAIVCATGFDTTYQPRFPILGREGSNLHKKWSQFPETYCSVAVDGFPNYFIVNGPNSAAGSGDLVVLLQTEVDYAVQCLQKLQLEGYKSLEVKREAVEEFQEYAQTYFKKTVFGTKCRTWYKSGRSEGPVTALWPGSILHGVKTLLRPRWEDYKLEPLPESRRNRFQYLGNGYTVAEEDGLDTAWYVMEPNSELVARNGQAATALMLRGQERAEQTNGHHCNGH